MLETFNKQKKLNNDVSYEDVACHWLNQKNNEGILIYEEKRRNFPHEDKPALYIGGIFPITGQKYRAPELAKGCAKYF